MEWSERVENLAEGNDPKLILRVPSGLVVMGDSQWLLGYCLLIAYPPVSQLSDITGPARTEYLSEMGVMGEIIQQVTQAKRMNYAIYGNVDPFLHTHLWPRFDGEDPLVATKPPLSHPEELRNALDSQFDPIKHGTLMRKIKEARESYF